jgi:rare lipoprotein A
MRTPSSSAGGLGVHRIGRVGLRSLAPAVGAALLATGMGGGQAEAKTPGKTYCFYGKCHRVKTIAETEALVGAEETVRASHYDSCKRDRYNPCGLTSSGEEFNSEAPDNAASPIYPDGTTLLVWSPDTRASIVLRVNNAGPYWGDRKLDVSRRAAEVLGFAGQGVATLRIRVIDAPSLEEATYKRNRRYDPVPGYIGQYASLDEAQSAAATAYMVAGLPSPFVQTAALGAGNPTQVAGASGTQSGATPAVPTVLAAADDTPAEVVPAAAPPAVAKPVKLASVVAMTEVDAGAAAAPQRVAALDDAAPPVRRRSHAERSAKRNSRSYRVAARQKQKRDTPSKAVAVAAVQRVPQGPQPITQDGTNDMSVFSRHVYAGQERLATQERQPRRPAYSSAGRYGMRDDDNG